MLKLSSLATFIILLYLTIASANGIRDVYDVIGKEYAAPYDIMNVKLVQNSSFTETQYQIIDYSNTTLTLIAKTDYMTQQLQEVLLQGGVISVLKTQEVNVCGSVTREVKEWVWTNERWYDYACLGYIWGGDIYCSKSKCAGKSVSVNAGGSGFLKIFEAALGFSYSEETCTGSELACTKGTSNQYSKMFVRVQKQNFRNKVREYKVCSISGSYDKTFYAEGTVKWNARYECHYETNENGNCPSEIDSMCRAK